MRGYAISFTNASGYHFLSCKSLTVNMLHSLAQLIVAVLMFNVSAPYISTAYSLH